MANSLRCFVAQLCHTLRALTDWLDTTHYRFALTFALCFGMLVSRCYLRLVLPELWAEDGVKFLPDALHRSWAALFEPYAGYFHTLPRLIAWSLVRVAPVEFIPEIICVVCLAIYAYAVAQPARNGYDWLIRYRAAAVVIAVGLCFVPGLWEVAGNLANLHWVLFVFGALMLLRHPAEPQGMANNGLFLLAVASAGEMVLLVPLTIFRLVWSWRARSVWSARSVRAVLRDVAYVAILIVGCIVNLLHRAEASGQAVSGVALFIRAFAASLSMFFVEPILGGYLTVAVDRTPGGTSAVTAFFLLLAIVCLRRLRGTAFVGLMLFGGTLLATPWLIWVARPGSAEVFTPLANFLWQCRYSFVAGFGGAFAWLVCACWLPKTRQAAMLSVVCLAFVHVRLDVHKQSYMLSSYGPTPRWKHLAPILRQSITTGLPRTVTIPIKPDGWVFRYTSPVDTRP